MPDPEQVDAADGDSNVFKIIETVADPDGIIAVITERERDGRVSFSLFREYETSGKTKRTSYMRRHHITAIRRLLNDLEDRLELAEDRTRAKRR